MSLLKNVVLFGYFEIEPPHTVDSKRTKYFKYQGLGIRLCADAIWVTIARNFDEHLFKTHLQQRILKLLDELFYPGTTTWISLQLCNILIHTKLECKPSQILPKLLWDFHVKFEIDELYIRDETETRKSGPGTRVIDIDSFLCRSPEGIFSGGLFLSVLAKKRIPLSPRCVTLKLVPGKSKNTTHATAIFPTGSCKLERKIAKFLRKRSMDKTWTAPLFHLNKHDIQGAFARCTVKSKRDFPTFFAIICKEMGIPGDELPEGTVASHCHHFIDKKLFRKNGYEKDAWEAKLAKLEHVFDFFKVLGDVLCCQVRLTHSNAKIQKSRWTYHPNLDTLPLFLLEVVLTKNPNEILRVSFLPTNAIQPTLSTKSVENRKREIQEDEEISSSLKQRPRLTDTPEAQIISPVPALRRSKSKTPSANSSPPATTSKTSEQDLTTGLTPCTPEPIGVVRSLSSESSSEEEREEEEEEETTEREETEEERELREIIHKKIIEGQDHNYLRNLITEEYEKEPSERRKKTFSDHMISYFINKEKSNEMKELRRKFAKTKKLEIERNGFYICGCDQKTGLEEFVFENTNADKIRESMHKSTGTIVANAANMALMADKMNDQMRGMLYNGVFCCNLCPLHCMPQKHEEGLIKITSQGRRKKDTLPHLKTDENKANKTPEKQNKKKPPPPPSAAASVYSPTPEPAVQQVPQQDFQKLFEELSKLSSRISEFEQQQSKRKRSHQNDCSTDEYESEESSKARRKKKKKTRK